MGALNGGGGDASAAVAERRITTGGGGGGDVRSPHESLVAQLSGLVGGRDTTWLSENDEEERIAFLTKLAEMQARVLLRCILYC